MRAPNPRTIVVVAAATVVAAALVLLGRITAHPATAGYLDGLRVGQAQGVRTGRALQEGSAVSPQSRRPVQDAFDAGYAAGANDAFSGYDGGWALSSPYLVTLQAGSRQITYRISSRTPVEPDVNYYLCAGGHDICREPRR